jgi:hypothetical protein
MKTIANRLIVIAASAFALGTLAFGQTSLTAQIPFAFRTAGGNLPAGTYQLSSVSVGGASSVIIRDAASGKASFVGSGMLNVYKKAPENPVVVFRCAGSNCSISAIRTGWGSVEYNAPKTPKNAEVAVIEVPLKALSAD